MRLYACIGSLAVGFILALYNVSVRHNTENEERDKAISEVFNEIKDDYVNKKSKIIEQIDKMDNELHYQILFSCYKHLFSQIFLFFLKKSIHIH